MRYKLFLPSLIIIILFIRSIAIAEFKSEKEIIKSKRPEYSATLAAAGFLEWRYLTGGPVQSSPKLDRGGNIYFGSNDNILYVLTPNGTLKWSFSTGDFIQSSPALANDGTIYIGSNDGYLYALNPNSSLKWSFDTG